MDFSAVAAEVAPAHIIYHDKENVWSSCKALCRKEADQGDERYKHGLIHGNQWGGRAGIENKHVCGIFF
jgi:hypothetical protein